MSALHALIYLVKYLGAGVVAGSTSTAFGIGGAALSTPLLRVFGIPATLAVATTLPSILPGAVVGWYGYRNAQIIDYRAVLRVVPGGLIGAIVGSALTPFVPGNGHLLMVATAAIIGWLAVRMLRRGIFLQRAGSHEGPGAATSRSAQPGTTAPARPRISERSREHEGLMLVGAGLLAGLLSGLLGLGGGIVLVPAFIELLGFPLKRATATSLVCIGCLAVPSTIVHAFIGDIDWTVALALTAGTIPGARIGTRVALQAHEGRLQTAMGIVLTIVALVYGLTELLAASH